MAPLSPPPHSHIIHEPFHSSEWRGVGLPTPFAPTKLCVFCVLAARKRLSQLLSCGHTRDCLTAYLLPDNPPTHKSLKFGPAFLPPSFPPIESNWGRLLQGAEYSLLLWSQPACFWDLGLHAIQTRGGQVNHSLTGRTYFSQQDWEATEEWRWTRRLLFILRVPVYSAVSRNPERRAARPRVAPDCTAEPVCISNAILLFQIFLFCFCGQVSSVQDVLFLFSWRRFGLFCSLILCAWLFHSTESPDTFLIFSLRIVSFMCKKCLLYSFKTFELNRQLYINLSISTCSEGVLFVAGFPILLLRGLTLL